MKKKFIFGKKSSDISKIKNNFIPENDRLIKWQKKLFNIYKKEKNRNKCKNCDKKIGSKVFTKIGVPYYLCSTCGHLNAKYKDSMRLAKKFYQHDDGKDYSTFYISNKKNKNDYKLRTKNIYIPKVDFLFKSISKNINNFNHIDVGCGAGHYISALKKRGVQDLIGYDPSRTMINFGNKVNQFNKLNFIEMTQLNSFIKKLTSRKPVILSMIGTFEHISNNIEILKSIKSNKLIKYFYMSVPCFSLSSFIELTFDKFYQRLMAPQHTHFYTERSLKFMEKKYKINIISEWWFGVDVLDLLRSFELNYHKEKKLTNDGQKIFKKMFPNKIIDELQNVLDKNKLSAEAHVLFKVNK